MGLLAGSLARIALHLAALSASALSGLALVRLLDPGEYSAYQAVLRRAVTLVGSLVAGFNVWVYRYVAQDAGSSRLAALIVYSAASLAVAPVGYYVAAGLGAGRLEAAMGGVAGSSLLLWATLLLVLDASRPIKAALLAAAVRGLMGGLVLALVYLLGAGLSGAFASVILSSAAGVAAAVYLLRGRGWGRLGEALGVLGEWVRGLRSSFPAVLVSASRSLDVAVALAYSSSLTVAMFFAARLPGLVVEEASQRASSYLQWSLLGGRGGVLGALEGVRLVVALASPLVAYTVVSPGHVMSLLNPGYSEASGALAVLSASSLVMAYSRGLGDVVMGSRRGGVVEAGGLVLWANLADLAASLAYLALAAALLYLEDSPGAEATYWAAAHAAMSVASLALYTGIAARELGPGAVARLHASTLKYPLLALAAAYLSRPGIEPAESFTGQALIVSATLAQSLAIYLAALAVLDGFSRRLALRALRSLRRL